MYLICRLKNGAELAFCGGQLASCAVKNMSVSRQLTRRIRI